MRLTSFAFLLATAAVLPMPLAAQETIGQQVVATDAANSAERPIAFAAQAPADAALLVMLGSGELPAGVPLTAAERDAVIAAIASGGFAGKSGEVLSLRGVGSRPRILLAGTGEAPNAVAIRDAAGKAAQDLRSEKSTVAILGAGSGAAMAEAALGYALGQYRFDRYKTGAKTPPPGAAVTIAEAPSVPPAPGLFSMMTVVPNALPALSAKARITPSLLPPAGQGAMKVIGRDGNLSCACATPLSSVGAASAAAPPAAMVMAWRRLTERGGCCMACLRCFGETRKLAQAARAR